MPKARLVGVEKIDLISRTHIPCPTPLPIWRDPHLPRLPAPLEKIFPMKFMVLHHRLRLVFSSCFSHRHFNRTYPITKPTGNKSASRTFYTQELEPSDGISWNMMPCPSPAGRAAEKTALSPRRGVSGGFGTSSRVLVVSTQEIWEGDCQGGAGDNVLSLASI